MLTMICQELKNWFIKSEDDKKIGVFTISDGVITPSVDLKENQYFRIIGSVYNDGVHKVGDELQDEEFKGAIWVMYIPAAFVSLVNEIEDYQQSYGKTTPFTSESFGGYSYSKKYSNWKEAFSTQLNAWRKI